MDFSLTREQEMLKKMVRDFAEGEVFPRITELDEKGELPYDLVKRMSQLGLIGIFTPKDYGGSAMGFLARVLAIEEISRVYPPLGFFYEGNDGGLFLIQTLGSEEQKKKYLPPLCKGERISCFGVTEATGGSDPTTMLSTAELKDNDYILNGRKVFITLAGVADLCCVVAKTKERFSAFIVEKGTPGFEAGRKENLLGLRSIPVGELVFTNCRVPKENLLGAEGDGLRGALTTIIFIARPGVSAIALGTARGLYETALKFAKERKLYGSPIAELQAIQFALADMEMEIEASKWLCYYTAWLIDQGKSSREVSRHSARAKLFATEMAIKIGLSAIRILGGYGVTPEYQAIKRFNDALTLLPAAGTSEIMRVVIGREIIR